MVPLVWAVKGNASASPPGALSATDATVLLPTSVVPTARRVRLDRFAFFACFLACLALADCGACGAEPAARAPAEEPAARVSVSPMTAVERKAPSLCSV
jgi:hypothetical protein